MQLSAQLFFRRWVESVHEMQIALVENWRSPKEFTPLVKSSGDCVIRRVAKKLDLECYPHDYYSIDAVLYERDDLVPGIPENSTWLRALSVAFEHENDSRHIYTEVSHLLITNTDLRVLVTYPYNGIEDRECGDAHSIILGSRHAEEISNKENFLLIMGWERKFQWQGFVFKRDRWTELENLG